MLSLIHKTQKKVQFSLFRDIILIPKNSEIYDRIDLWWSDLDKRKAFLSMYTEIKTLQNRHPDMTYKQALKLLYQPNNIRNYDATNFTN
jgi:hypothetical protein